MVEELTAPSDNYAVAGQDRVFVSMENLFLYAANEVDDNLGYLLSNRHASHCLRLLLMIFSGLPLERMIVASQQQGKKKKEVNLDGLLDDVSNESKLRKETLPSSFIMAADKIISNVTTALRPSELRALARHSAASPLLQLIIELESMEPWKSHTTPDRAALQKLLVEDSPEGESGYAALFNSMLYDPVGSHLLEVIIRFAPSKMFKQIYQDILQEKIGEAAKSSVAGFVAMRALERLGKKDLENATKSILLHFDVLVRRSQLAIVRTIIDRYVAHGLDHAPIARAIRDAYAEQSPSDQLQNLLRRNDDTNMDQNKPEVDQPTGDPVRVHGSLLVQAMLAHPGPLSDLAYEGLLDTPTSILLTMAEDPALSRLLQSSLTLPTSTPPFRRRLIATFLDQVPRLASHPVGSHLVDALWVGTKGLQHYRERIAQELCTMETALRGSHHGRSVWRNWKMDLYKDRRMQWTALSKASLDSLHSAGKPSGVSPDGKSGIELARQRHAAKQNGKPFRSGRSNSVNVRPLPGIAVG